jgi:hypothetical protein
LQILQGYRVKLRIEQQDPEAAKELDNGHKINAVAKLPPAEAVKVIRQAKSEGKVTAAKLRQTAEPTTTKTTETLEKIVARLELLNGEKFDGYEQRLLAQIIETATELRKPLRKQTKKGNVA